MTSKTAAAGIQILSNPALFSRFVLSLPLYAYQLEPITAVLQSISRRDGEEFLLVFSRQSGKNEAVAHLLVYLLNILRRRGGNIVYAATGDGLGRGIQRLEKRLDNAWNRNNWHRGTKPVKRGIGAANVVFISSHPQAAARGETADHLLVIDELQDVNRAHMESVLTPMRAANNATAIYLGTVRSSYDALWLKKIELEQMQKKDGRQRVFWAKPDQIIPENPDYGRFLERQEAQLGRHHPIIASEYYLEPLDIESGFFPPRRIALMRGKHLQAHEPNSERPIIATIDLAGIDEAATDPIAQLENPGRDYTVCTIFEVHQEDSLRYHALDVFIDHGSKHFDDHPGRPSLAKRLLAFLSSWQINHVVVDATGIGEGMADFLRSQLGASLVTGFKFTRYTKAALGSSFLSLVETGRFSYFSSSTEYDDSWWFFTQAQACAYELPPGGQFDRDLRWYVPEAATVSTPAGNVKIHDDRLISAALVAEADELITNGSLMLGLAKSEIIETPDIFSNLSF